MVSRLWFVGNSINEFSSYFICLSCFQIWHQWFIQNGNSQFTADQARSIIEADLDYLDANDSDTEVDVRLVTDSGKVNDI